MPATGQSRGAARARVPSSWRCRPTAIAVTRCRTREEVEKVRHDQDPIEQVRNRLLAAKVSEQELKDIDGQVREIVNAAADFAQHDAEPDAAELYTDIYR